MEISIVINGVKYCANLVSHNSIEEFNKTIRSNLRLLLDMSKFSLIESSKNLTIIRYKGVGILSLTIKEIEKENYKERISSINRLEELITNEVIRRVANL
ncbi:hypothetical protein GCM10027164_05210 [Algoriphagus taiwanensis]|uniref:Uncharacterized protein n=1 Tax=Algoriphagus taiwanensis TaxID=1445656 RepID=A0ABQ6PVG0_9BACT|nr:hypothetical protein Ataiwa_02180 [Algoriphagus taiwanensis]